MWEMDLKGRDLIVKAHWRNSLQPSFAGVPVESGPDISLCAQLLVAGAERVNGLWKRGRRAAMDTPTEGCSASSHS